jgi:signal transduction histidine kinase/ActR/RegA family two-component response regulator
MTTSEPARTREERILVLAPWGRDAHIIGTLLEREGLTVDLCLGADALCRMIMEGAGAALLTEEAIADPSSNDQLVSTLRLQPPWSELPLIVLTGGGSGGEGGRTLAGRLISNMNATLLERPLRAATLFAAVRAALRARGRQYELRELLEKEQASRAEAETANRRKDAFLAMLGHELRNPLAAIRNAIAVARLDAEQRARALDIAHRQTAQLAQLVDDLVDVARVTQGKIRLRKEHVVLGTIIQRAIEATRPAIDERGHTLTVGAVPLVVLEGDPTRLEQVLVNLLSNAAKYTPPGGIIEISTELQGDEVLVRVRDNGTGIAPGMLPRVFDLFAQADDTLNRSQGGLGIGLTIVRQLVELHGGHIEALSDGLAQGAEFVVRLPTTAADHRPAIPATPVVAEIRRRRVLLVEDNLDAAESMKMLLELFGHSVRVVHDGERALVAVREQLFEIMLIDVGLPGMDGYELVRRLREIPAVERCLLIALTGYGRDEDKQQALAAGFHHHLAKPIEFDALQTLIGRLGGPPSDEADPTLH